MPALKQLQSTHSARFFPRRGLRVSSSLPLGSAWLASSGADGAVSSKSSKQMGQDFAGYLRCLLAIACSSLSLSRSLRHRRFPTSCLPMPL